MHWRPILEGSPAERAHEAVAEIAEALLGQVEQVDDPSLAAGLCGPALFFSYLHRARPADRFAEASVVCLERAMDLVAAGRWPASLFAGFGGVGWTIGHLRRWVFEGEEDPLENVDEALRIHLGSRDRREPAELMNGLSGLGVYFLERLPGPRAREGLEWLLARLEETAEWEGSLCTWHTDPAWPAPRTPDDEPRPYNLGVAHGVPGVIGFLAGLCQAGVEPGRARRLAEGAVGWLLAQQLPPGESCRFPDAVGPGIKPVSSRTAWCYGDLGIAAVVLLAARSFGRQDWAEAALAWARLAAQKPLAEVRVIDAGLCHGAAGLSHLFLRLHQATGDTATGEAARAWFERTLAMRRPGEGLAGFQSWSGDGRGGSRWRGEPGFLTGVAGIGLALLAALSDVEPCWDRVLLSSVAPAGPFV